MSFLLKYGSVYAKLIEVVIILELQIQYGTGGECDVEKVVSNY
jgi:hypothetical protein